MYSLSQLYKVNVECISESNHIIQISSKFYFLIKFGFPFIICLFLAFSLFLQCFLDISLAKMGQKRHQLFMRDFNNQPLGNRFINQPISTKWKKVFFFTVENLEKKINNVCGDIISRMLVLDRNKISQLNWIVWIYKDNTCLI